MHVGIRIPIEQLVVRGEGIPHVDPYSARPPDRLIFAGRIAQRHVEVVHTHEGSGDRSRRAACHRHFNLLAAAAGHTWEQEPLLKIHRIGNAARESLAVPGRRMTGAALPCSIEIDSARLDAAGENLQGLRRSPIPGNALDTLMKEVGKVDDLRLAEIGFVRRRFADCRTDAAAKTITEDDNGADQVRPFLRALRDRSMTIDAVLRIKQPAAIRSCRVDALSIGWSALRGEIVGGRECQNEEKQNSTATVIHGGIMRQRGNDMKTTRYSFLVETYATERQKILGVWAMFRDWEMPWRPYEHARSVHEQMVHQCVSEDYWMKNFLGIDLEEPPLPAAEIRLDFMKKYASSSAVRLEKLEAMGETWFEEDARFFDVTRTRAWILVRRFAHSAHHRGQLTTYLRILGHALYSTYGPTADTGGLFQNNARVIYQYADVETLLESEATGGGLQPPLPGPGEKSPTERP